MNDFLRSTQNLTITTLDCYKVAIANVRVRTLDLKSIGRGFNFRSGRYQVVTTKAGIG